MQLNTNCPHCWKQLFHWFCSTMNLNATLVLPVLGEYLIFVDIHYWFQFFEHFRIREPPVPVLWGKIWTKELEYKHCNTSAEWVFDFANIRQFQFFKHFRTRELPVLVLWKTIQDQRTASSGSLENNSGSKNCQFLLCQKLQPTSGFHERTVKTTGGYERDIFTGFFKHAELAVIWFTNSCKTQNWGFFDSAVKERKKPLHN